MAVTASTTQAQVPYSLENFAPQIGPVVKAWAGLITLDASYPTGGYALSAATFGMSNIDGVVACTASNSNTVVWTGTNLKVFVSTTGAEVANATDLHTVTVSALVVGR